MMGAIKAITLDNVLLQENGILRDENGLLIARLVDSVKFDDIENSKLKKENKMKVTRKEEPELFNEIGEMIIDNSQNDHRRGSTFYVKAIVEFKSEHKQHYPNVQDFYKYVGYWETNQYVRSEDDVDLEEITELTKVELKTEMVEVKKWVAT